MGRPVSLTVGAPIGRYAVLPSSILEIAMGGLANQNQHPTRPRAMMPTVAKSVFMVSPGRVGMSAFPVFVYGAMQRASRGWRR